MGQAPSRHAASHNFSRTDAESKTQTLEYNSFGVQPPHQIVHEDIEEISRTYRFFLHIWGIKCRNLHNASNCFVIFNWDDYAFEKKTKPADVIPNSATVFKEAFQFTWTTSTIKGMDQKFMEVSVYEDDGQQGRLLGTVKIDLYEIATGPIHHDLRLELPGVSKLRKSGSSCPRVVFDLQMSQVCQLIINPVELVVHLAEAPDVNADVVDIQPTPKSLTHPETTDSGLPKFAPSDHPQPSCHVAALIGEDEAAEIRRRSLLGDDHGAGVGFKSGGNAADSPDDFELFTAEWALAFDPTGQSDGGPAFWSCWSEKCAEPSWTSLIPLNGKNTQPAAASSTISETVNRDSLSSSETLKLPIAHDGSLKRGLRIEPLSRQFGQGSASDQTKNSTQYPVTDSNLGSMRDLPVITNDTSNSGKKGGLTNVFSAEFWDFSTSNTAKDTNSPVKNNGQNNLANGGKDLSLDATIPSQKASIDSAGGAIEPLLPPHTPSIISSPTTVCEPSTNEPTLPLDLQASYKKLAEMCKGQRRLARDLLSPVLPTLQLETTIEQLRQRHISVRLYVRRIGMTEPRLYGEVWLPFMKLYDLDVVEDMDRNFHDAYFREAIWLYGRCIGHLEGLVLFQNNPAVAQMLAGVRTENGRKRLSPAILSDGDLTGDVSSVLAASYLIRGEHLLPPEVKRVATLHGQLLDCLFTNQNKNSQTNKHKHQTAAPETPANSARVSQDLAALCEQLLLLLKQSHAETRKSYIYVSSLALLIGQRVLLTVADHVLEYLDVVQFAVRPLYSAVLHQILRRGELDVGTCLPEPPSFVAKEELRTIYYLYKAIKQRHSARLAANKIGRLNSMTATASDGSCCAGRGNKSKSKKSDGQYFKGECELAYESSDEEEDQHPMDVLRSAAKSVAKLTASAENKSPHGCGRDENGESSESIEGKHPCLSDLEELERKGDFETLDMLSKRKARAAEILDTLTVQQCEEVLIFHKRMRLCLAYKQLLLRMLYYSLDKLGNDAVFEGQKKYLSLFLCLAYFRVPQFRKDILNGILTPEERSRSIDEWRGTEFGLDAHSLTSLESWNRTSELRAALDWDTFQQCMRSYFGPTEILRVLRSSLKPPRNDELWRERLLKRSTAFFSFLEHWSKHVFQATARKGDGMRWHLVPGYPTLLKALLIEMRNLDVTRYPDSLLNCSGSMLANDRLLSVFVKILFLRTSVYNTSAVFSSLNYLDYWVQVVSLRGNSLPPTFDFLFLLRGLETLLTCGVGVNVAKGLWFVYKNTPIFRGPRLRLLLDLIISRHFKTLFLSWSWLIRRCIFWFLLYRVCEAARHAMMRHVPFDQLTPDEQSFLEAYHLLSTMLSSLGAPPVLPITKLYSSLGLDGNGKPQPGVPHAPVHSENISNPLLHCINAPSHAHQQIVQHVQAIFHSQSPDPPQSFDNSTPNVIDIPLPQLAGSGLPALKGRDESEAYKMTAIAEFSRELSAYRDWVISGTDQLPPMHIPATPLDYSTDVPLENW